MKLRILVQFVCFFNRLLLVSFPACFVLVLDNESSLDGIIMLSEVSNKYLKPIDELNYRQFSFAPGQ